MAPRFVSGVVEKVDAWQQKRTVPAFLVATWVKYRDDRGQQYAALLSYYGFISIFPLLLLFVSIITLLLHDDPTLRDRIVTSLVGRLPVIGTQIQNNVDSLQVHGLLLLVGFATLLWAGLKVVRNAQNAFNEQWGVPYVQRQGVVRQSIRGLAALAVIGAAIVGATAVTSLAAFGDLPGLTRVTGALVAIVLNIVFLGASFEILTEAPLGLRVIAPGALLGGVALWLLQLVGGTYVERVIADASDIYGAFATVFGLLIWLALMARVALLADEVNVVLRRRAWPRTFVRTVARPHHAE
ncbi:MAG TPA: YihY/virulence factor BrkB family protein [Acidimicrobiales bacterium]|nr:YihY/virulence factor BrkB family protein [Acidimicrobiales bacterium]